MSIGQTKMKEETLAIWRRLKTREKNIVNLNIALEIPNAKTNIWKWRYFNGTNPSTSKYLNSN